jgi:hypothetical protein
VLQELINSDQFFFRSRGMLRKIDYKECQEAQIETGVRGSSWSEATRWIGKPGSPQDLTGEKLWTPQRS